MSIKVYSNLQYGNARVISVTDGAEPEVVVAAEARNGAECLWFYFKVVEHAPPAQDERKLRVVLRFFENLYGGQIAANLVPVARYGEQAWARTRPGKTEPRPDGQLDVSWVVSIPNPTMEFALCFPYGRPEIDQLVAKSRGAWNCDSMGVSCGGRPVIRLSNDYAEDGCRKPGIYLIARQHAGETPGSWVLDGVLQQLARTKRLPYVIWVAPLLDIDGIIAGDYGNDSFPYDLGRAWGDPPRRHETLIVQRDLARWRRRCDPVLALDFHAPGGTEADGMYCHLPDPDRDPAVHQKALKWANVIGAELGTEFAAQDFKRVARGASRWATPDFASYCNFDLGIPALTVETPYALAGQTVLTQKSYREAGGKIAIAVTRRLESLHREK